MIEQLKRVIKNTIAGLVEHGKLDPESQEVKDLYTSLDEIGNDDEFVYSKLLEIAVSINKLAKKDQE